MFLCVMRDAAGVRRAVLRAVSLTVLAEAFVNYKVLSLPLEIALVPVVVVFSLISMFATRLGREDLRPAREFSDWVLVIVGSALIAYVLLSIATDWGGFDKAEAISAALLPLVLTVGSAPYFAAAWPIRSTTIRRQSADWRIYWRTARADSADLALGAARGESGPRCSTSPSRLLRLRGGRLRRLWFG
jgi:hypothetical protein